MANSVLVVQQNGPGGPFYAYDITVGLQASGGTIDAALQAVVRKQAPFLPAGGPDTNVPAAHIPAIYTAIYAALTEVYAIGATEYRPDGTAINVKIFGGPLV